MEPQTPVSTMTIQTRNILGFEVLDATAEDATQIIDVAIDRGPLMIAFVNAHSCNVAADNHELQDALRHALLLNDGIGVDLAAKVLHGSYFVENLNGTDYVPLFLATTRHRFRIYGVGADPGVAARALEELQRTAPEHAYLGARDGYFPRDEQAAVAAAVRETGADLVLVALGTPYQEIWSRTALLTPDGPSVICVGGLFDFLAGNKPRAYPWVRRLRCEWLFRLAVEPSRLWRRYLVGNLVFMARLVRARFASRSG